MSLNTTPKGAASPQGQAVTPQVQQRPQINLTPPKQTTARVEALKAKLNGQPVPQQAPRRAGTSARAEQYAKLPVYGNQQQQVIQKTQPFQNVEPPPSGLANPNQPPAALDNSVEPTVRATEAAVEPSSEQFALLAKQERAMRRTRQELKAAQDALRNREADYVSKKALLHDPLKILNEAGIAYDRLTELQLSQANPDPNQKLLDKISELEGRLAKVDEQFTTRENVAYEAAVKQIRNDAKLLVDSDPSFETIKNLGQTEEVVELIKKVHETEDVILSVEEAASLVEEKLLEVESERFKRLQKLSKFKSKLGIPAESPVEAIPAQQSQQIQSKTLSNQGAISRPLTARERAILAFENARNKV